MILKAAQTIMSPYKLNIAEKDLNWWTAYQIGQRVSNGFSLHNRCFIAGDACHTHSPKAGQGMNVSMMDTYNLTWKIAKVLLGQSPRSILSTYQSERRQIAEDLIAFDHKFSRLFSGKPRAAEDAANEAGVSLSEFKDVFAKGNKFASGTAVEYEASLIVGREGEGKDGIEKPGAVSKQELSREDCGESRIVVGARFNTAQVVCVSDARPWQFIDWLPSDGRWRLVLFSGDIMDPSQKKKVNTVAVYLQNELIPRYTPHGHDVDSVIDVLTISSTPRIACELTDYPEILRPMTTRWHQPGSAINSQGKALSRDYWKVSHDADGH
jgi:phenol 2-monooxygenase